MEKGFDFLKSHNDVAFATSEGGRPKIRVFQIMKQEGHSLYFATSATKEVYRQLQENPYAEILAMEGNISVRIWGKTAFNVDDATAKEIYENNPVLQRLYRQYRDLAYFRLDPEGMDYFDLAPTPARLEHYSF